MKKAIIAIVLFMAVTIGIIAFLIVDEYTYCKQVRHVNEIISAMQNDDTEAFSTLINDPSRSVERPRRSALSCLPMCSSQVFFVWIRFRHHHALKKPAELEIRFMSKNFLKAVRIRINI